MFVNAKKERKMFVFFILFSISVSWCPYEFKQRQAECLQAMKAQTNRPSGQLFLI